MLKTVFTVLISMLYYSNTYGSDKQQIIHGMQHTGDTTVNGKDLREYNRRDRERFLKEIREAENRRKAYMNNPDKTRDAFALLPDTGRDVHTYFFKKRKGHPGSGNIVQFRNDSLLLSLDRDSIIKNFRFDTDSVFKHFGERRYMGRADNSIEMPNMIKRRFPERYGNRTEPPRIWNSPHRNSQSFSFRNTDKDGITTRIVIDVYEPLKEEIEKIPGKHSNDLLVIEDLSFTPAFSSDKVTIMFTLPDKGATNVKLLDSQYKVIFSQNMVGFSGSYVKAIQLPKNGIYFLVVDQNAKSFIRKVVKQN